jgi:hypothetical protein
MSKLKGLPLARQPQACAIRQPILPSCFDRMPLSSHLRGSAVKLNMSQGLIGLRAIPVIADSSPNQNGPDTGDRDGIPVVVGTTEQDLIVPSSGCLPLPAAPRTSLLWVSSRRRNIKRSVSHESRVY